MDGLTESIIEYIKRKETNYAIMIDGAWGSGKTYYWENVIRPEIERIDQDVKLIYITLYGINSIDEISKSIFLQTITEKSRLFSVILKSSIGKATPEVGKILLNGAALFGISVGEKKIDFTNLTTLKNTVICFDDLERANIEISEILGFINNFVEHDHIKTIILANEKEISEKISKVNYELKAIAAISLLDKSKKIEQKINKFTDNNEDKVSNSELIIDIINETFDRTNEYKRIKEKLVGKTLVYKPDYYSILSNIISQYKYNKAYFKLINTNKVLLIDVFYRSNTFNLRIFKYALNDFETIYTNVVKEFSSINNSIILTLMIFTIALSLEIKSGNMESKVFSSIETNNDYLSEIFGEIISHSDTKSPIVLFHNKYFNGKLDYTLFKFVVNYILTGIIDYKEMKKEMTLMLSSLDVREKPFERLFSNHYWEFSDNEFDLILKDTYAVAKNGEMHYALYFKGYLNFYYMDKENLLLPYMKDYSQTFTEGLELAAKGNYKPIKDLSVDLNYIKNTEEEKDKTLMQIKQRVIEINRSKIEDNLKVQIEQFFEMLDYDIGNFIRDVDEKYCTVPIFKLYDMKRLFSKLIKLHNRDLGTFINILRDRYKNINQYILSDLENLIILNELISEYKKGRPNTTLSNSIMNKLGKTIIEIVNTSKG